MSSELRLLAEGQLGVLTRQQLVDAGVTPATIRWQLGSRWRSMLPGVIALTPGPPTYDQRLVGALLKAGPNAWLGGSTALAWHGLPGYAPRLPVIVFVPTTQRARTTAWMQVRRTSLLGERLVERGPLRVSCLPRAVVDAAAEALDDTAAAALVISAVQERLVRLDDVAHWVSVRRRNGRARLDAAVASASYGAWSVPEAQLLALIQRSPVLPPAWANPRLVDAGGHRLTTPDAWMDDVALAVMVHSRRFHGDELDWDATVSADEDLRAADVEVVAVTPRSITQAPGRVLATVHEAYQRAARRPRPSVRATPRATFSVASG